MLHQTIMISERQHHHHGRFKRNVTSPPSPKRHADGSSAAHAQAAAAYMRRPSNCGMRPPPISRNKSAPATPLSRSATVSCQING